jgi:S1-C subfamily serine protease
MSEYPNQPPTFPPPQFSYQHAAVPEPLPPPKPRRFLIVLAIIFVVLCSIFITPWLAEHIAYAWNRGVERAKAEIARKLLADHPAAEQRIAWVAKAVSPCVVGIHTFAPKRDRGPLGFETGTLGVEIGSGVIVDPQGYILTNYHVIAHAHMIMVRLSDGREVEASIVGRDRTTDLAVLRIDAEGIEAVDWGDSRNISVGDQVLAIGSPYDLQQTVTAGIISATERYNKVPPLPGTGRAGRLVPREFLQTDAAINPGNSGGALVDMNAKLIGINTAIISAEFGGNAGIGFAIPSFTAKTIYEEIISNGKVRHGWIGIYLDYVTVFDAQQMGKERPKGAVVKRFKANSPAEEAGLEKGDIILRWGKTEITDPLHLIHLTVLSKPGTTETVEVFRKGEILTFDITIGVKPVDLQ